MTNGQYFRKNFSENVTCYISFLSNYNGPYGLKFSLDFLTNEGYKSYILEYNETFYIEFNKYSYNDYKLTFTYYHNIANYIELKELNTEAKRLQKEYNNTVKKIEALTLKQKELYHNFTDYLQAFTYNTLNIKTDITIY